MLCTSHIFSRSLFAFFWLLSTFQSLAVVECQMCSLEKQQRQALGWLFGLRNWTNNPNHFCGEALPLACFTNEKIKVVSMVLLNVLFIQMTIERFEACYHFP